jgi:hypothetical protein
MSSEFHLHMDSIQKKLEELQSVIEIRQAEKEARKGSKWIPVKFSSRIPGYLYIRRAPANKY